MDNLRRVDRGQLKLGFAYSSNVYWSLRGEEGFEKEFDSRVVITGQQQPWILWAHRDSGINSWGDLKGKRVSGPPAGGVVGWRIIEGSLAYHGLSRDDLAMLIPSTNLNDVAEMIKARQLDALAWPIARGGVGALIDLVTTAPINYVGMEEGQIDYLLEKMPFLKRIQVEPNDFERQPNGFSTVGEFIEIFTMASTPEQEVYDITKTIVENLHTFPELMPAGIEWTPERAIASRELLPYHPGAIRYYKEIGVWKD